MSVNMDNIDFSSFIEMLGYKAKSVREAFNPETFAFKNDLVVKILMDDPDIGEMFTKRIDEIASVEFVKNFHLAQPIDKMIMGALVSYTDEDEEEVDNE